MFFFLSTTAMRKGNNVILSKNEKTQLQEQGLAENVALSNWNHPCYTRKDLGSGRQ